MVVLEANIVKNARTSSGTKIFSPLNQYHYENQEDTI